MKKSNFEMTAPEKVLIIGISGSLAQKLAKQILLSNPNVQILGVDARDVSHISSHPKLTLKKLKYTRAHFEQLFLTHQFDSVFHLARMGHGRLIDSLEKRLKINVLGTSTILNLCKKSEVKNVTILSTFHVYGALPDNPAFIDESAPLRASIEYPELRDVVEMDQLCQTWMWENQNQIHTVILRPTNIIGPQTNNAITQFLASPITIKPIDYNPRFQFIHETDMTSILMQTKNLPIGVYNVAKENDYIPLKDVFKIHKPLTIPLPLSLTGFLKKTRLSPIPAYMLDYLKFSCLISGEKLNTHLGDNFYQFDTKSSIEQLALRS